AQNAARQLERRIRSDHGPGRPFARQRGVPALSLTRDRDYIWRNYIRRIDCRVISLRVMVLVLDNRPQAVMPNSTASLPSLAGLGRDGLAGALTELGVPA